MTWVEVILWCKTVELQNVLHLSKKFFFENLNNIILVNFVILNGQIVDIALAISCCIKLFDVYLTLFCFL